MCIKSHSDFNPAFTLATDKAAGRHKLQQQTGETETPVSSDCVCVFAVISCLQTMWRDILMKIEDHSIIRYEETVSLEGIKHDNRLDLE